VIDPIVGIDLGTSNTVVAHADPTSQVAQVLADANGFKIHPSVVSFHPSGGVVVGAAAKQRKVIDPKNTIFSIKRLIGRSYKSTEVQTAKRRMPYEIKEGENQLPLIVTRGGQFAVPEISAIVLDHAKNVATHALGMPVGRAVVTVPASFNDAQRSATATAGSIAGLTVVRVLNEPTAAALAYGSTRNLHETIAVYDFGGGTFDITILKLADQVYEVLGTAGDTFLGGDDLDERLVDRMVEKFLSENRVDLRTNEVSMMRLRAVAEQTKIELSRRSRALVRVDEIAYGPNGKPLDLQIEIRRDEFVQQVADIIDRTFPVCQEALKYAGLSIDGINDVILVGGTTKIPYVRDQVAKFFAKAPRTDVNPEDAVAVGAGLQAKALERVLNRKKSSQVSAQVAVPSFPEAEGTFSGGETNELTQEQTFAQANDNLLDLEQTQTDPHAKKRATAGYETVKRASQEIRATERPVTRGAAVDRFEVAPPTPPPTPDRPVIGRLTKDMARQPAKTSLGIPVQQPPAPPRLPPKPPTASPQARTLMVEPPQRPSSTVIVDEPVTMPTSQNMDFPNYATETGILDLEDHNPASTAKGFAPAAIPPAPSRTITPAVLPPPPAAPAPMFPPQAPTMIAPQSVPVMPQKPMPAIMDVTPRGLGIATVAGFCEELIRRNSRVPMEIRKVFSTSRDHQDAVRIIVCQGESRRLDNNVVIGDLRLEGLPRRPRGETSIEVTFQLDANGILQVKARDAQTGNEQRASLDVVGSVPQADVSAARERIQALRR
jgi:molecular chaperone DnaK